MSKFRWYVARCEQAPSGCWRLAPDVALPHGTHLRYFHPPGRRDVALVRVHHVARTSLDQFDGREAALKIKRIPFTGRWSDLKDVQLLQDVLDAMGVDRAAIPDNMPCSQVIDRIGRRLERFERKRERRRELAFLRDAVEE